MEDFRGYPFARPRVDECGRFLGERSYWKLYSIENYLRVIVHSVLSAQIAPAWWDDVVDPTTKKRIVALKKDYLKKPMHTSPGSHDIYYLYLSDLTKILTATRHLVGVVIKDIDSWVVKLESVRIPRNLVGHMNFPNAADRDRIDTLYIELGELMKRLENTPELTIKIP